MSILLADIDATCSSLGHHAGDKYYAEEDAIQSLKVKKNFIYFYFTIYLLTIILAFNLDPPTRQ